MQLLAETARIHMPTVLNPEKILDTAQRLSEVFKRAVSYWRPLLIAALVASLYYRELGKLAADWWRNSDSSHGFVVPPFAAYLIWVRRKAIQKAEVTAHWGGIVLVAAGLMAMLAGEYGAELFVLRVSFIVVLAGLVLGFGGPQIFAQVRFALLVLLLAIPLPRIVLNEISMPLQILASEAAGAILPLFSVPVLREGNVINLPSMQLEVAEACSGIRSLESLLTLSVFYGYLLEPSTRRRVVLALSSIPIAITANTARIVGTGLCVHYWNPEKAVGFFHEFSGWAIFLVSMGLLFCVHRTMMWIPTRRTE